MARLFISYSRKDIESARKLTTAFKGQDLDFWIDWEGIPPTVDWWKEIEKGIEEADIFLFLISPDSAKSEVCKQEIEHAVKNGKRLIPVVIQDVKADESPSELRPLNWIFLRESDNFSRAFGSLMTAIKTDYEWVQTHRQLQVKALEWERSDRENSFLLRGKELQDAGFQLAVNSSKDPSPTNLQREYVFISRKAKTRQRRVILGISTAIVIIIAWLVYAPLKSWLTAPEMPDWTPINFYQGDSPSIVTMNLRNPDEVYATGQSFGVLYRSTNGGKTWDKVTPLDVDGEIIGLVSVDDKIYALTNRSVWLTRNEGETWSVMENPVPDTKSILLSITINPRDGNEIYIGSADGNIYHTKDTGANWDIVQPGYNGKSIKSITTNGSVMIVATEQGLWVNVFENNQWEEISLEGCSERSDEVNALALTSPYSEPPDDGAFGFIAAIPGVGICDSDSKNLYGNTLLSTQYTDINSITIADQAELIAYEGYFASNKMLFRKRIWSFHDYEWWSIKINSLFMKGDKNE